MRATTISSMFVSAAALSFLSSTHYYCHSFRLSAQRRTASLRISHVYHATNGGSGALTRRHFFESQSQGYQRNGGVSLFATSSGRPNSRSNTTASTTVPSSSSPKPQKSPTIRKTQLKTDLKQYRLQQSAPLGKPAYTIFTNAALDEIYARLPTTLEELLQVKGIGPKKCDMFGTDILNIVSQYTTVNGQVRSATALGKVEGGAQQQSSISRPPLIDGETLTVEQRHAANLLLSSDRPNVFVSGSAGTGKSYVLQYIVQEMQRGRLIQGPNNAAPTIRHDNHKNNDVDDMDDDDDVDDVIIVEEDGDESGSTTKTTIVPHSKRQRVRVGVCAPTGVAAIHVGGSTLHSFFGIGLGSGSLSSLIKKVTSNNEAVKRIDETDTLIIDECSMLSSDLLELLDAVVRQVRKEGEFADQPFGGMQVICFGDFFQLPPIAPGQDKPFCFESHIWTELGLRDNMVELLEVQRQDHRDFVNLLHRVRLGQVDPQDLQGLNARCVISEQHPLPSDGIVPTRLYSLNKDVDAENEARLAELGGKEVVCVAQNKWKEAMPVGTLASVKKAMADSLSKEMPAEVRLKVGAQVMLTRNKDLDRNLVNGSRGVVIGFERSKENNSNNIDAGGTTTMLPVVRFDCGVVTSLAPVEALRYNPEGGPGCLARSQIPLKLAWAITVHKSQGTTLTRALLDISSAFEYGQCYVALSRVRSLEGLWLVKPARLANIKVSPQVLNFYNGNRR